jgi:hypothetical protein
MTIHHLTEVRVRTAQMERMSWKLAIPLLIGLSVVGWGGIAAGGLGLWRITGL